jgi:hypothetical protein
MEGQLGQGIILMSYCSPAHWNRPAACLSLAALIAAKERLDYLGPMRNALCHSVWMLALALTFLPARAAEKIIVKTNQQTISAYRTADLEEAKKEAVAAHKPIAWIASAPKVLDGKGTLTLNNGRGATLHAFAFFDKKAVIVFMDAYEENHKVLELVDTALHTPEPHYTPPTVVLLDPEAKRVLATVVYEADFTKRVKALVKGWEQVKGKY